MESLVSHCSQSIQSKPRLTLLHHQRIQLDRLQRQALTKIIHKTSGMQQVHTAVVALASRIIMVPVDREDRHTNAVVWVKIIN